MPSLAARPSRAACGRWAGFCVYSRHAPADAAPARPAARPAAWLCRARPDAVNVRIAAPCHHRRRAWRAPTCARPSGPCPARS